MVERVRRHQGAAGECRTRQDHHRQARLEQPSKSVSGEVQDTCCQLLSAAGTTHSHGPQLLRRECNLLGPSCCCPRCRLLQRVLRSCTGRVLWWQHPQQALLCCSHGGDRCPAVGCHARVAALAGEAEVRVPAGVERDETCLNTVPMPHNS